MSKDVEITLKKEGSKDIVVKCPKEIKMNAIISAMPMSWVSPTFKVKPTEWKDVVKAMLLFIAVFIACAFFSISVFIGVVALCAMFVANVIYTKNYYFNFIRRKIAEGYIVEDSEQTQILKEAGIFDAPVKETKDAKENSASNVSLFKKIGSLVNRLPFARLVSRVPVISGFAKYANYAFCIIFIILIIALFTAKDPIDTYLDNMDSIVNRMGTLIEKCENSKISFEELQDGMDDLASEIVNLEADFDSDDMSEEQMNRLNKVMRKAENLQGRADRLNYE